MISQKGFSLAEVMVAVGLVAVIGFSLVSGIVHFRRIVEKAKVSQVLELQINDIVENIRPNINRYQVTYEYSKEFRERRLAVDSLPNAWDVGIVSTVAECPSCLGRYGFLVQPYTNMPGLYVLTVRMTYKGWSEGHKDYSFLVTTK
jgi:prepilin-type N-terminal cleavage/methylation domain-containing protein